MALRVVNPFDQEVVAELALDDDAQMRAKAAAARRAFEVWSRRPLGERAERVQAGLQRFRARADEIAREVTLQMGKPIREARREVQTLFERAEHMMAIAAETLAPEVLPAREGLHRRIEHAPLGVVLDIAAWNYPLLIPVNVVVPALLAGNAVLLKHSARTPLCGERFAQAFADPDLPGLVASLNIGHEQTAALIADPRAVDYVAFTGSVAGGRSVYRQASQRILDVGLELGGKDPAYVAEDADLDFAVDGVVDGACYNAGQSCCAVERVYVHRRLYDEFLARARAVMERYRLGDPLDERTTLGPLAGRPALDLLERQVEDAVRRAVVARGPAPSGHAGELLPAHPAGRRPQRRRGHAGGELRTAAAGAKGGGRRGGAATHERHAVRPDGVRVDARPRTRGPARGRAPRGHRVPEPLRLPGPRPALDRGGRERDGLDALALRLLPPHPAPEHPPARSAMSAPPAERLLKELQERGTRRVKIGIADLDGVLRGKYLAMEKLASLIEGSAGFCDCIFGWDSSDQLYDNAQFSGWHKGFPDVAYQLDLATMRWLPHEKDTPFFLAELVPPEGSRFHPICPRNVLKRVLAAAAERGLEPRLSFEYEFFVFQETPQSVREKNYRGLRPFTPGMFGYSVLRTSVHSDLYQEFQDYCEAMVMGLEGFHTETGPG